MLRTYGDVEGVLIGIGSLGSNAVFEQVPPPITLPPDLDFSAAFLLDENLEFGQTIRVQRLHASGVLSFADVAGAVEIQRGGSGDVIAATVTETGVVHLLQYSPGDSFDGAATFEGVQAGGSIRLVSGDMEGALTISDGRGGGSLRGDITIGGDMTGPARITLDVALAAAEIVVAGQMSATSAIAVDYNGTDDETAWTCASSITVNSVVYNENTPSARI